MKLLQTDQQIHLQYLLQSMLDPNDVPDIEQIEYWAEELKPKRVRRKKNVEIFSEVA